jgi:hypothetical protein
MDHRQQLRSHEITSEVILRAAYTHMLSTLQPTLDALYKAIAEQRTQGDTTLSWLYQAQRMAILKQRVTETINQYAVLAEQQVVHLQHLAIQLASQGRNTPDMTVNHATFAMMGAQAAQGVSSRLIIGISTGLDLASIVRGIKQVLSLPLVKALTIARTALHNAYRASTIDSYSAQGEEGWIWWSLLLPSTCFACLLMHGTRHKLSEKFASHPNCRCSPKPITPETLNMQTGVDWFEHLSQSVQQAIMGNAAYKLWKSGVSLQNFVGHDKEYDGAIYQRSVKEVFAVR